MKKSTGSPHHRLFFLQAIFLCLSASSFWSCTEDMFAHGSGEIASQGVKGTFTGSLAQMDEYQKAKVASNLGFVQALALGGLGLSNSAQRSSLDATTTTDQLDLSPLALHVGLQILGKGGKFNDGVGTTTSSLTYLEVPLQVVYRYSLPNKKGRLFGGFGPYFGFGVGGKIKYSDPTGTESYSAFDKLVGYKRFDSGLSFVAGYQIPKGFVVFVNYELGLSNIETTNIEKTYNRVLGLNVGYSLSKLTDKFRKK